MTRVFVITSVHPSFDVRIFWKQARSLVANGFDVKLVAAHEDPSVTERLGVKCLFFQKKKMLFRLERLWYQICFLRLLVKEPPALAILHDPELIPLGWALKGLGWRVIFDAHEDLPDQLESKPYISPVLLPFLKVGVQALLKIPGMVFDGVMCATHDIQKRFLSRSLVVRNFPLLEEFPVSSVEKESDLIVYVGGLTRVRGILEIIAAVNLIERPVRLSLAGKWESEKFKDEALELDHKGRVTDLGFLDRDDISSLLAKASVGAVVLKGVRSHVTSLPVKMFEYMACETAVVASNFSYWDDIIYEARCGVSVDPDNVEKIAEAFQLLVENPAKAQEYGRMGRMAVENRFSWDRESVSFLRFVTRISELPL